MAPKKKKRTMEEDKKDPQPSSSSGSRLGFVPPPTSYDDSDLDDDDDLQAHHMITRSKPKREQPTSATNSQDSKTGLSKPHKATVFVPPSTIYDESDLDEDLQAHKITTRSKGKRQQSPSPTISQDSGPGLPQPNKASGFVPPSTIYDETDLDDDLQANNMTTRSKRKRQLSPSTTGSKNSVTGLSQPVTKMQMTDEILKIVFINLQSLKDCSEYELIKIKDRFGFNVLALCETWHHPEGWKYDWVFRKRLKMLHKRLGKAWSCQEVPCRCSGLGRHGMAIFCAPELDVTYADVILPTLNNVQDHRQAAVIIMTRDGKHECHLVACHYKSCKAEKLASNLKRLQIRATINHLSQAPPSSILIAGGDFNVHPEWPNWGEVVKQFGRIEMSLESYNQLWVPAPQKSKPWTHEHQGDPSNMLDHVAVRTPAGLGCSVELLGPNLITTDHKKFLLVTVFTDPAHTVPYKTNTAEYFKVFPKCCGYCGRGFSKIDLHRKICPFDTDAKITTIYNDALAKSSTSTKTESHVCPECQHEFKLADDLTRHLANHSKDFPYPCPGCDRLFKTKGLLNKHVPTHSDKRSFPCPECGDLFKTSSNLNNHIKSVHSEKRSFSCPECGDLFKTQHNLNNHLKSVHSDEKPHHCPHCEYRSKTKWDLKKHLKTSHSNERSFACPECGDLFKSQHNLNYHIKVTHSDVRSFPCPECGDLFKSQHNLNSHLKVTHSDERPFPCPHCEHRSKTKGDLKKHEKTTHSDEKPHHCPECEHRSKTKSDLKQHMTTTHSEERAFSCPECGDLFKTQHNLNNHLKSVHSDVRSFLCPECGDLFKTQHNLNSHLKSVHSDERPFPCPHCEHRSKTKWDLKKHKKRRHAEEPELQDLPGATVGTEVDAAGGAPGAGGA